MIGYYPMSAQMSMTALEKNAAKVYAALRKLGAGWHSRPEIARVMNAPRLHTNHVAGLELLVSQGKVIAEKHDAPVGPIERRWEYRLVDQEANEQIVSPSGKAKA